MRGSIYAHFFYARGGGKVCTYDPLKLRCARLAIFGAVVLLPARARCGDQCTTTVGR